MNEEVKNALKTLYDYCKVTAPCTECDLLDYCGLPFVDFKGLLQEKH